MDKLKAYMVGFLAVVLAVAGIIVWKFDLLMLIRLILSLGFGGVTLMLLFFAILSAYVKNWKFCLLFLIPAILSGYATYLSITWQKLEIIGVIIALYILGLIGFVWYISEPDLGLIDRFKSAEALEKIGKYQAAARKYEKEGNYIKAAEMYFKLGWLESAAWAYEKAKKFDKAAELYEKLYEKENDVYYLKEAYEFWKKSGNMDKAVKALEEYAKEEPWFWEDVAKLYENLGNDEKAKYAWEKALEYYINEAKEEGVFWEDVGKIAEKLGKKDLTKEAYEKFLDYCLKEAESDGMWWKHVAEAYEYLGEKEKAKEAWKRYEEYRKSILSI
ncbi:tetratricopeptide repeat protein [Methanocaldococcus sp. 28A]